MAPTALGGCSNPASSGSCLGDSTGLWWSDPLRAVNKRDFELDRDIFGQPNCSVCGAAVLPPFAECRNHQLGRAVKDARLVEEIITGSNVSSHMEKANQSIKAAERLT
jgi:hypothetical protein